MAINNRTQPGNHTIINPWSAAWGLPKRSGALFSPRHRGILLGQLNMTDILMTDSCPCGSGQHYPDCCGQYHAGMPAPTAEALMRSRYSAYALKKVDYIINTTWPCQQRQLEQDRHQLQQDDCLWLRLAITRTEAGQPGDLTGIVEFNAWYQESDSDQEQRLQEESHFIYENGRWYYIHPGLNHSGLDNTPVRKNTTPSRNDPCPCGSNKKYKKCCRP